MAASSIERPSGLYERYREDLRAAREAQRRMYERQGYSRWQPFLPYRAVRRAAAKLGMDIELGRYMNPMLDDTEAELTYLRIRELRPSVVVEVGPYRGWSTTWILRALRDNGAGSVISFDRVGEARRFVPADLAERWELVVGDVRDRLADMPESIDYLFIDADHRRPFAEWYLAELVPRVPVGAGGSVHDVFHGSGPARGSGEARVILDWLDSANVPWFTPSRFGPGSLHDEVQSERIRLGLDAPIHYGDHDSMVFFEMTRSARSAGP